MKPQDSYSLNTLASSLAAAIAMPALFVSPQAAAQSSGVSQLAPVRVEGEASSYQTSSAQSPKMTAPLLDTPRTVQVVPKQVIQDQSASTLQDAAQLAGHHFGAGEGGRPGGDLPIIRGQNSAGSIFLDGIRDASTQVRDTLNLEQVEVIRDRTRSTRAAVALAAASTWSARRPSPPLHGSDGPDRHGQQLPRDHRQQLAPG